jgi:ATP-binding cassette subfamily C protein
MLINLQFTLTMFLIFSFILFTFLFYTKKINFRYANQRQLYDFKQIKDLNESFTLFKYIKIHHLEKIFFDRFSHSNKQVNNAGKFEIILNELPKNIFELASILTIFFAILFFFSNDGMLIDIIPFLGFLVLAIGRMIPSLTRISNSLQSFRFSEPALKVLNNEIILEGEKNFFDFKNKIPNKLLSIKLDNISFNYDKKSILKNVSLELKKKYIYGITGETGSGKTTLIDIIVGLHGNYTGNIFLNDKKLTKPLYQSMNIAYVPQNIFLVDDTIKNNILINKLENKTISLDEINQAINTACLDDFLSKLDNGAETLIGENGVSISGGQKQRIGLARSLINKPDLLILDEATNALNHEVSNKIIKNLKNYDMSILIISHNKEIIKNCDKVLHLKNGNIKIL